MALRGCRANVFEECPKVNEENPSLGMPAPIGPQYSTYTIDDVVQRSIPPRPTTGGRSSKESLLTRCRRVMMRS